jgi:hypothetical protein
MRIRLLTPFVVAVSSLVLASCANTSSGGGVAAGTEADTTTSSGKDTTTSTGGDTGTTAKTDTTSQSGTEKSIVDIQKASAACTGDPASFGDVAGLTIRNAVVASPARKQTTDGSLVGIYVQQKGGGQWSGIYVIGKKDSEIGQVAPGDVITITGDVKDYYCFTEMNNKFAVIESQGQEMPMPVTVTTADIGEIAGKDKTEPYEGVLVQLHDVVVGDDALGSDGKPHGEQYVGKTADEKALRIGSSFFGVYLSDKNADGTYSEKYPKGTKLGTLTGVLQYSFGAFTLVITKDPENVVKP